MQLQLPHQAIEAAGGLARAALAQQRTDDASQWGQSIYAHWSVHGHFNGTERPWDLCLAAFEALGADDARALSLARFAWDELSKQAARLPAAARATLWQGLATHRRLRSLAHEHGWT